jgi:beta-lactamase regulating signal transducer with metallopeptidase domain
MHTLLGLTISSSAAILAVALMRQLVRRIGGARVAYALWLLVPASMLAYVLPQPPIVQPVESLLSRIAPTVPASASFARAFEPDRIYVELGLSVWGMGVLLMLALTVRRHERFIHSLSIDGLEVDGVRRSAALTGPVLVGLWRPRIVVPLDFESRYDADEQAWVLAHERAHRRRGDLIVNLLAALLLCCFWFNPFVYWAAVRLRVDQELACDEAVLEESGADGGLGVRARYARALLKTQLAADFTPFASIGCHWQSVHPLRERIAMLKRPLPSVARRLSGGVLTFTLVVSGCTAAWKAQPPSMSAQHAPIAEGTQTAKLRKAGVELAADRVMRTADGGFDLFGVSVKGAPGIPGKTTFTAKKITFLRETGPFALKPGQPIALEGDVRIVFAGGAQLTTDRAVVGEKDSYTMFTMDSAHLSSPRPLF